MKNKLLILNHKCNFTMEEMTSYVKVLKTFPLDNIILCPSTCYLASSKLDNITLGSQDVSLYNGGAYTGEVSARQLKSLGVNYSLVGHYERVNYFEESLAVVHKKIENLLQCDITPIVCVSESTFSFGMDSLSSIMNNLDEVLDSFTDSELEKIIIAYEPYYSIGSNIVPTIDDLNKIFKNIHEKYPKSKLIYGGSVNLDNIDSLNTCPYIDGYLIGNLSLDINSIKALSTK